MCGWVERALLLRSRAHFRLHQSGALDVCFVQRSCATFTIFVFLFVSLGFNWLLLLVRKSPTMCIVSMVLQNEWTLVLSHLVFLAHSDVSEGPIDRNHGASCH